MELRDYLITVRKHHPWIWIVTTVAIGIAALVTLQTTPTYASAVTLFVGASTTTDVTDVYQGGLFTQQRITTYADFLDSDRLASAVARDVGGGFTAKAAMEAVAGTVQPDTNLLTATATHESPKHAQRIAATVGVQLSEMIQEVETPVGARSSTVKVTVIDEADLPTSPVSPKPLRNLGLAAVLGLLLGMGLAVLRETLDTSLTSTSDLSDLEVPPLGTTIYDPEGRKRALILAAASQSPQSEAFRQTRTNLQFVDVDSPPRTVVVTSSVPEEGKTTTVVNLALTLAFAGVRTCLVDGDLRRSKIAKYLNLEGAAGLTTVLAGRAALEDVLQPYGETGVMVLPSGAVPPNPSELLGSQHMAESLAKLTTQYDMVLIDSPPLLPVTDAAVLSGHADGVIVIARFGSTRRDQLAGCLERLRAVEAKVLGGVLTMVPSRAAGSYGYRYGYGYGYATADAREERPRRRRAARRT